LQRIAIGLAIAAGVVVVLAFGALLVIGQGMFGSHEGPGTPLAARRPAAQVADESRAHVAAAEALGVARPKQILFGDLHVHTTVSFDAFLTSMPVLGGDGAHPQADACDFARFCSSLDFWSITDHAEQLSPQTWQETAETIRACNEAAGDGADPDSVAFLGWEWTQVGLTPETHFGHKNVVLAHTDAERIPSRPIAAAGTRRLAAVVVPGVVRRGLLALLGGEARYHDLARYFAERASLPECPDGVPSPQLPGDCIESAETPAELFRKLDEWGHEALVIPHGTTWGLYTPPGSSWDKQLDPKQHDPKRQKLFEIYSGHGDSEAYRDWHEVEFDSQGHAVCPAPRLDYEPTCWRAGELIRARCLSEGGDDASCEQRAVAARANAAVAGGQAHLTVPGAGSADWLDAGQCRDCDQPAFNYRPGGSAQYVMALSKPLEDAKPLRFRFGFLASSDNHFARPGTGFKEVSRKGNTESRDRLEIDGPLAQVFQVPDEAPIAESRRFERESSTLSGFRVFEMERQASFFMTGGLVAAHASGRDRASIWDALSRREVYGTTGARLLLWFDLLNPLGSSSRPLPMGSETRMLDAPIFQVRAVGSFEQKPGCPDYTKQALSAERLQQLCLGECYYPSDTRRLITRIEIVRITPRDQADEPMAALISDPWRVFACQPDPAGCAVTFSDPDFATVGRDALYYARAYEEPAQAINAGGLRCERDADGQCTQLTRCGFEATDDCLAPRETRAWSSPIFVDYGGAR
jgi:hypothetical protein